MESALLHDTYQLGHGSQSVKKRDLVVLEHRVWGKKILFFLEKGLLDWIDPPCFAVKNPKNAKNLLHDTEIIQSVKKKRRDLTDLENTVWGKQKLSFYEVS